MKYLTGIISLLLLLPACSSMKEAAWMPPEKAKVYIQAGHEGRTTGATGATGELGKEIDWTPVVADTATRILEEAGISVIRSDADRKRISEVDLALSLHFDSSGKCWTGASIGYGVDYHKPAADHWKELYGEYFPYKWMQDNYTENLSQYYNFKYTRANDASLVLELGEIDCNEQAQWLEGNLETLGHLVAYFAAQRVGNQKIAKPILFDDSLDEAVASTVPATSNLEQVNN